MNHAFRGFVEAYTLSVIRSELLPLSIPSLLFFPIWTCFSTSAHRPWTRHPAPPKYYSLPFESKIGFQINRFADISSKALQRIDAASPLQGLRSHPLIQLRESTDGVQHTQPPVNIFQRFLAIYKGNHARSDDLRSSILTLKNAVQEYESYSKVLQSQLQSLSRSFNLPSFPFSRTGLVAVPESLLDQVQHPPFEWREQTKGNEGGRSVLNPHAHVYSYNLDKTEGSPPVQLRSALVLFCQNLKTSEVISGSLSTVCTIWLHAASMSGLDDTLLESLQRNWAVERLEAVRRYERSNGVTVAYQRGSNAQPRNLLAHSAVFAPAPRWRYRVPTLLQGPWALIILSIKSYNGLRKAACGLV